MSLPKWPGRHFLIGGMRVRVYWFRIAALLCLTSLAGCFAAISEFSLLTIKAPASALARVADNGLRNTPNTIAQDSKSLPVPKVEWSSAPTQEVWDPVISTFESAGSLSAPATAPPLYLDIYDIHDLFHDHKWPPPAPRIRTVHAKICESRRHSLRGDQLSEIISAVTAGAWNGEASLEIHRDQLIVFQSAAQHEKIRVILAILRELDELSFLDRKAACLACEATAKSWANLGQPDLKREPRKP